MIDNVYHYYCMIGISNHSDAYAPRYVTCKRGGGGGNRVTHCRCGLVIYYNKYNLIIKISLFQLLT